MYEYIYFDLDDTLVKKDSNGKEDIVKRGLNIYNNLRNKYPTIPFRLLTNRVRDEISFPNVYHFDEIVSRDETDVYVVERIHNISWKCFLNLRNIYIYLIALYLYKTGTSSKVMYLFLRHTCNSERVLMVDRDKRISLLFR